MNTARTHIITLKNCAFFAHHGVMEEETRLGQRFYVDAVLWVQASEPLSTDKIEATVHYGEVFTLIEEIVTGQTFQLIEALADTIAQQICRDFPLVRNAAITVRKPSAPIAGVLDYVEVTVSHPEPL